MKILDILFINPCINFSDELLRKEKMKVETTIQRQQAPHIGIAYLLAISKKEGILSKYIDMSVDEVSIEKLLSIINENKPLLIGFTCFTIQIKSAGFIANIIKNKFPGIKICVGGPHATAIPEETLSEFQCFDFVVVSEAEDILLQIINNINNPIGLNKIPNVITRDNKKNIKTRIKNLDDLPFPSWESFDLSLYPGLDPHRTKRELQIVTSRGCPFSCSFCARMFGKHRISRFVESVIDEIESGITNFGAESFTIIDETFMANPEWNIKLFNTMIDKGLNKKIKWSCETRIDTVSDKLLKLMRKAGCYYIFFGFEHTDSTILKTIGKKINSEQSVVAANLTKNVGIVVSGCFILGLPGETIETARKNMYFAKSLDIYSTSFPLACPYPGTLLRKQAENHEYGLQILSNNWDDYGKQHPGVLESNILSIQQLRELQKEAYMLNPKKNINDYEKINTFI